MASRQSTARKSKSQPVTPIKPILTSDEVQRIAERLAAALENDAEHISLLTLLFDHLEVVGKNSADLWSAIYGIKKYLFVSTSACDDAQEQFQSAAYQNRGKLLMWPHEQKEVV